MKRCNKCQEEKSLEEFYLHKKMKDGRHNQCKACSRVNNSKYEWSEEQLIAKRAYNVIYHRKRREVDLVFNLKRAIRGSMCVWFKSATKGKSYKLEHTEELLQCSLEFFIEYIQKQFTEGMTLENYGQWHLDHIIPLATAKTREDVVHLSHYSNFQPLWAKDNLSKGAKITYKIVASLN